MKPFYFVFIQNQLDSWPLVVSLSYLVHPKINNGSSEKSYDNLPSKQNGFVMSIISCLAIVIKTVNFMWLHLGKNWAKLTNLHPFISNGELVSAYFPPRGTLKRFKNGDNLLVKFIWNGFTKRREIYFIQNINIFKIYARF